MTLVVHQCLAQVSISQNTDYTTPNTCPTGCSSCSRRWVSCSKLHPAPFPSRPSYLSSSPQPSMVLHSRNRLTRWSSFCLSKVRLARIHQLPTSAARELSQHFFSSQRKAWAGWMSYRSALFQLRSFCRKPSVLLPVCIAALTLRCTMWSCVRYTFVSRRSFRRWSPCSWWKCQASTVWP